ncbi:hypothetical protein NLI96_g5243 [Meripilus lineatus]|uniref:Aminoacyl-transfer RNA synthetases class-II family profile domain-containing protein n=1 Tax=Meripilus lineatus TaxID=2056292 RepID=A0AAD5V826_9APHY|nr:hypothetical protein NLI96_g5243 [Physisporinus lineatus]
MLRKAAKKFSFFPLKDSYGTTQLVVFSKDLPEILDLMRSVTPESTVLVQGVVNARPESQRRPVPSGDVEVVVTSFTLLNPADANLPFMPSDVHNLANEDLRLRHRYLDLRRLVLVENLRKRSQVAHIIRTVLHDEGFTEVETPILLKSTPEGAREFLVPTRLTASSQDDKPPSPLFYALPQSPQQPKQLLIASGAVDRYYQIAKCFRDEDGRKDRQPEFTQVDLEMAWVSWGDHNPRNDITATADSHEWRIGGREVKDVVEKLIRGIWGKVEGIQLPEVFRIITYQEAMQRYGSDKPDVRFGLEIQDITYLDLPELSDLKPSSDEVLEALIIRSSATEDEPFLRATKELRAEDIEAGIKRLDTVPEEWVDAGLRFTAGGTIFLAKRKRIAELTNITSLCASLLQGGSTPLGRLRLALSNSAQSSGDLTLPLDPHFLWVTEFPLFTRADEDKEFLAHGRWSSSHHPFTAPMWQDVQKMHEGRIGEVRGQHYDLVLNGVEIGGGSVRVHDAAMQEYIFSNVLQLNETEKSSFNHLLHALKCGAPPHGGIALGK